jgi:lipopolysaccharide export LptBFGC system permease protein LptF
MLSQVRWLRVVIAAFVIEVGLIVTGLPLLLVLSEALVYRVAVPVLCIVVPFVVAFFAMRPLPAARVMNGFLTGVIATAMYFVLVIVASSIAEASAAYGLALFIGVNALRIVSAAAGGYAADRRAVPSAA